MDPTSNEGLMLVNIPKIIMQTWKNKTIPEKWQASHRSIEELMPDWSYVLMTDEDNRNFVAEHFPDFLETYDSLPYPIVKADAIRYMWLYINGGIYLDLDYQLEAPLDPLFYQGSGLYFMKSPNFPSHYTNSVMASVPRHPFWLELIDMIREAKNTVPIWTSLNRHFSIMYIAGPGMLSRAISSTSYPYTTIPYLSVAPCDICTKVCDRPRYLTPLGGASWAEWDSVTISWALCYPWYTVGVLILMIILAIVMVVMLLKWYQRGR